MNAAELLADFRSNVVDTAAPYLWSDEEIYGYMDEAQRMFCRLTYGISDASSPVSRLSVKAGEDWVTRNALIKQIRNAYRTDNGREIRVANYDDLGKLGLRLDGREGQPELLILGMDDAKIRIYPRPIEDTDISMLIFRLPRYPIEGGEQELEVNEQHHEHLIWWMRHRAYSKQDAEARNDKLSAEGKAQFEAYCAFAKAEQDRAKHKTRVVTYGGI